MDQFTDSVVFWSPPFAIEPAWVDYNGHLNMAYYHVLFDRTLDLAFEEMGIGPSYVAREKLSFFNVETHVCYLAEVAPDDRVRVSCRIVDRDTKRLHAFQQMVIEDGDRLAATAEILFLHVDLTTRRATPWSQATGEAIDTFMARDRDRPRDPRMGRRIGLSNKR